MRYNRRRISESRFRRSRKRMIRESFDDKFHFRKRSFKNMSEEGKEGINRLIEDVLDSIDVSDLTGKPKKAVEALKKGKVQKVDEDSIFYSIVSYIYDNIDIADYDFEFGTEHEFVYDVVETTDLGKIIADRFYDEYPELDPKGADESLKERKIIRKIARIIREAEERNDF